MLNNFRTFKEKMKEFYEMKKEVSTILLRSSVQELGEKYGNFALVIIGYTPSFNDGDPCTHSSYTTVPMTKKPALWNAKYEYWDNDENEQAEDYSDFFEIMDKETVNTHLLGRADFLEDIQYLEEMVSIIQDTNYEVKIKYKNGEVSVEFDDYYCDY